MGEILHTFGVPHPRHHLPPHTATSPRRGPIHCNCSDFTRLGRTQRTAHPLSGRTVGSGVGNPGERGGEPRGAGWGALWSSPGERGGEQGGATPGSGVGSKVEQHRAVHTTPQAKESSGQIRRTISARNRIRRRTKWGAPVSRRAPLSTAVYVRRQSSPLRLSQRRS